MMPSSSLTCGTAHTRMRTPRHAIAARRSASAAAAAARRQLLAAVRRIARLISLRGREIDGDPHVREVGARAAEKLGASSSHASQLGDGQIISDAKVRLHAETLPNGGAAHERKVRGRTTGTGWLVRASEWRTSSR